MFEQKLNIAVTGATGFLGTALTEYLINQNQSVRVLAQTADKAKIFEGRADKIVVGDIADKQALAELVKDCDLVYNLVSNFRTASGPPESYKRINVEGTINAVERAKEAGVKRFVHCATIGVHGDVIDVPTVETSPYNPGDLYQETKLEGQQYVEEQIGKTDMEIVIVRPCSMYGPGDMRMLKMFKMLAKRRFFMLGKGESNFHAVYIDDIVNGFALAGTKREAAGETFLVGGEKYLPLKDYVDTVAKAIGVPPPFLKFPYAPFWYAAAVCEKICVPFGIEPPLHRRRVRFYKNNRAFDISKAKNVLGFEAKVDLETGMRKTVEWYKQQGFF